MNTKEYIAFLRSGVEIYDKRRNYSYLCYYKSQMSIKWCWEIEANFPPSVTVGKNELHGANLRAHA